MEVFEDEASYTQSRLESLNLNPTVKPEIYNMEYRAGYNKKDSTSSSSTSEYSFLFEQRLFKLTIKNFKNCRKKGITFTEDFKSAVEKLPIMYDKSDPNCVSTFESFFECFGHFVISSAYVGGSVEITCSREAVGSEDANVADAKGLLKAKLEERATAEGNASTGEIVDHQKTKALLERSTYSWNGGEKDLQTNETIGDKERLEKWKKSLSQNPTMLETDLKLQPISTAVDCIPGNNSRKGQAIYDALKDLLKCEDKQKRFAHKIKDKFTREDTLIKPEEGGICCFPSRSVVKVQNKDGEVKQKKMANLDVEDKVMAWDEERNRTVFTKVIMFAHFAPNAVDVEYLKITLQNGKRITLSGNHLAMVGKDKKAILARKVKPGDTLFSVDENQEISSKKVLAVEKVIEQGIFCPITLSGNVIVDNVLASCYASVEDHVLFKGLVKISAQSMAHLGLMPMRALHKLRSKWLRKIPDGQTIHPYLQWLRKLDLPCMVH